MFLKGEWFVFDSIDSTNTRASQLILQKEVPEGSVVIAGYQQSGRGQRGTVWQSAAGENLLMSVVLYPGFIVAPKIFALNQAVALAVYDTIAEITTEKIHIKWPNDIMVSDKKIGGILIENSFRGADITSTLAGVGLNVNQKKFDDFNLRATSLALLTNNIFDISQLAKSLHNKIEFWYDALKQKNYQLIDEFYHGRLYRLNEFSKYKIKNETYLGTIRGVDDTGKLLFEKESGELLKLDNKEIVFVF